MLIAVAAITAFLVGFFWNAFLEDRRKRDNAKERQLRNLSANLAEVRLEVYGRRDFEPLTGEEPYIGILQRLEKLEKETN